MSNTRTYRLTEKIYNRNMGIEYHDTSTESHYIFAIENYLQDWKAMVGDTVKIETGNRGLSIRVWVNGIVVYRSTNPQGKRFARMMRWVKSRKVRVMNKPNGHN